jgi:hypothetical protein
MKPDYSATYPRFHWELGFADFNPDYTSVQAAETLHSLAIKLLEHADDPESHINWLNYTAAGCVLCTYDKCLSGTVDRAYDLLSRLPRFPLELPLDEIAGINN